ncbi:hypothetical protein RHS01_09503 [Rhizoctonia solani]|uniref:DUF6535 domain-containing protein n=1 Tax=Rhizoctonia solani TaxID=456999 RepID=A0A8H7I531_9AGAM|nr:hypothetical protein RHS01_09503 [Rhizoctonia solani]
MLLIFVRSLTLVRLTSNVRLMWPQAALFSTISTAFILESTKDLKPDYAEVSAHTLAAILAAVSSGALANSSDIPTMDQSDFSPSFAAIQVNILWFTSLSLSVAVALITIVAKDWCYQFMATRTGPALIQGRRRQLRWEGIEQWRMREILNVLPLMMHAALLLFAVGLSLYLWDINPRVALPVVVTTVAVGVFYFVTLLLPLFFRYCPFTTGPMKLILPYWYRLKVARCMLKLLLQLLGWLVVPFVAAFVAIKRPSSLASQLSFSSWDESKQLVAGRVKLISNSFMVDRSQLDRQDTPMDGTTSSMLGWMIAQCENLDSVDMALQSLLCTKPWLPRVPLQTCGAFEATLTRLSTDLVAWRHIRGSKGPESEKLKESVLVQSQYLSIMSQTEGIKQPDGYLSTLDDITHLIDGIAKSFIHEPDQSPTPLMALLNTQPYSQDEDLCRMIGVALTMAYLEKHGNHSRDLAANRVAQRSRATKTYLDLTTTAPTDDRWHTCEQLLLYGILYMLPGTRITPPVTTTPAGTSGDIVIQMSNATPTAAPKLDEESYPTLSRWFPTI